MAEYSNFDLKKFLAENKISENSRLLTEWGTKVKSEEELFKALQKELGSTGPTLFKILGGGCPISDRLEQSLKANLKGFSPFLEDLARSLFKFMSQEYHEIEVYESSGAVRIRFADGKKPGNDNCHFAVEVSMYIPEEGNDLGAPEKEPSAVKNIDKDLADRGSDFRMINTKEKLGKLLDVIVNQLDPKFRESSAFKMGVREFFAKHR